MTERSSTTWRLIDTGLLSGSENMAIDESLLRCFDPVSSQPILRLYGWKPAALSLGRFQNGAEILDLDRCNAAAVNVVRRITGGGVIFHAAELTYSLVCSPLHLQTVLSIKDSFRVLTAFLLSMYRDLGLNAAYAFENDDNFATLGERTPFCFAGREDFDIVINGRKIGGNAQRRLKNVIFQHGSIPLADRSLDGLGFMRKQPVGFAGTVTSLESEGLMLSAQELRELLLKGWRDTISSRLLTDDLSLCENRMAERLVAEKYSSNLWNLEGEESADCAQA